MFPNFSPFVFGTIWFLFLGSVSCQCEGQGWVAYKNEKCYKLLQPSANWSDAQNFCADQFVKGDIEPPTLVSIVLKSEQEFVSQLLLKSSNIQVGVGVWLGASRIGAGTFKWENGADLKYTNWANGAPSNVNSGNDCVEIVSNVGKWRDSNCLTSKRVICQKLQNWSLADMQRTIIKNSQNTVPIGFIYAQLPFASSPQELWPTLTWQDISSTYSGRFFRVVGRNAPAFGSSQEDAFQGHEHKQHTPRHEQALTGGRGIVPKSGFGSPRYAIETRPINYSMKIWKRIA